MLDTFELEEEFVGITVRPAVELPTVVEENSLDDNLVFFEEGQDVVVEEVNGGQRDLGGVEPGEGEAGVAVDGGWGVDAAHTLEMPDVEGIHGEQNAAREGLELRRVWKFLRIS